MKWSVYLCDCDQQFALPTRDELDLSETHCPNCGVMGTSENTGEEFATHLPEPKKEE